MKKRHKNDEVINCAHYRWRIYVRDGNFYADGRSNVPNLKRHSLKARDRVSAVAQLKLLDVVMAQKNGLIDAAQGIKGSTAPLSIADGIDQYLKHSGRPRVLGGVAEKTLQRYAGILKKFSEFLATIPIANWADVTTEVVNDYGAHLQNAIAETTMTLEITTITQVFRYLEANEKIPPEAKLKVKIRKHRETTRYCWHEDEVVSIIEHCQRNPRLGWLKAVLIGLSCTGLRISELLSLRWADVKLQEGVIYLSSDHRRKPSSPAPRQTKNQRGRVLPIHPDLLAILDPTDKSGDDFLFSAPGRKVLKYGRVYDGLKNSVLRPLDEQAKKSINSSRFMNGVLHSFRHYFCSRCANQGVPENLILRWLGHRHSDMIRHYYHLHDEESKRQMEALRFIKKS